MRKRLKERERKKYENDTDELRTVKWMRGQREWMKNKK